MEAELVLEDENASSLMGLQCLKINAIQDKHWTPRRATKTPVQSLVLGVNGVVVVSLVEEDHKQEQGHVDFKEMDWTILAKSP